MLEDKLLDNIIEKVFLEVFPFFFLSLSFFSLIPFAKKFLKMKLHRPFIHWFVSKKKRREKKNFFLIFFIYTIPENGIYHRCQAAKKKVKKSKKRIFFFIIFPSFIRSKPRKLDVSISDSLIKIMKYKLMNIGFL